MSRASLKGNKGQGMVEYILIIALVAIAVIAAVRTFGGKISGAFGQFGDKIENEADNSLQRAN
jgi:Flp pilus assembly pilin Flp